MTNMFGKSEQSVLESFFSKWFDKILILIARVKKVYEHKKRLFSQVVCLLGKYGMD